MAKQELRPYQKRAFAEVLDAYKNGARRVLLTLPTGGGKTTVFTELAASIKGRVVVLVHRRELATQAANRMREFGVRFGYVMAGEQPDPGARVQIASVQTLVRRKCPPAQLVICDEAHLSTAATWQAILDQYPHAKILGCTATPWRLGGKPLVGTYDASVIGATPAELRENGSLCGYNGFSYKAPDLSGVAKVGDDYNQQQSGEAMRAPGIVADIVEKWQKYASTLSTVVFAVTVEHSKQLTDEFKAAGVRAEHLDGSMGIEQRKAILARVAAGKTQVLCNVGVAVEGLDIPRLKCCILARPTMSLARAIQMMGRVRRPWQGQAARIHDHAFVIRGADGNTNHGLPDAERDYTLHARDESAPAPLPLSHCEQCFASFTGTTCPSCGVVDAAAVERAELATIDSAEQVDFSSDDEAPAVERPPVQVEWNQVGRLVEGVFEGAVETAGPFGPQVRFQVRGEKRRYSMPGTRHLKALMRPVRIGDGVRVRYTGNAALPGGKTQKIFEVERDAAEDKEGERLRSEVVRLYTDERAAPWVHAHVVGISPRAH